MEAVWSGLEGDGMAIVAKIKRLGPWVATELESKVDSVLVNAG